MNRILTFILIFVLGALAALLVLGYFAYMIPAGPPEEAQIAGLVQPVEIGFTDQGTATIDASAPADAMTGLGYAQAASYTWPLVVYRAVATGQLTALVGNAGSSVDELAMRLGLASSAQTAYSLLGEEDRELLEAFADGVNAALSSRSVLRDPSLVLSGHIPETWMPWHTIAIERMFAWLASAEEMRSQDVVLDRPIKEFLRIHDLGESMIVSSERPSEPGMFVRYVWGSSALPVLFDASVNVNEEQQTRGACLAGTPFFISARSGDRAWAFLMHQNLDAEVVSLDSMAVETRQEILSLADGSERLISILSTGDTLVLDAISSSQAARTGIAVSWSGVGPVTDAASWFALQRGGLPEFSLMAGTGMILRDPSGSSFFGQPAYRRARGRMSSRSPFSIYAGAQIDSLMASSTSFNPRLWFSDTYSPWAATWTPRIIESLSTQSDIDEPTDEARSYLRNWNYEFDDASIGASIFATWSEEYLAEHGNWPGIRSTSDVSEPGDGRGSTLDLHRPFRKAVRRLIETYGYDLSVWRWEEVNSAKMYFPVLGRPEGSPAGADLSRYAPRTVLGNGHPTAPNWAPIARPGEMKPVTSWEGWTRMLVPGEWTVRRWFPDARKGIGSGRAPSEGSMVSSLGAAGPHHTLLVPED